MSIRKSSRHLPSFLIIGAMKSGTTTLYEDLATHPELYLPEKKEPNILLYAESSNQAASMYEAHFSGAPHGKVLGEATTRYSMIPLLPDVTDLAFETMGKDLKIIYVMRNPLDRIVSHLGHDFMSGRISSVDFETIVRKDPRYVDISDYATQLEPWVKRFGRNNLLCVSFERFVRHRSEVLAEVFNFIGVDTKPEFSRANKVSNPRNQMLAAKHPLVRQLIESKTYTLLLRRALPDSLRLKLKKTLSTQKEVPEINLSPATMTWLSQTLKPMQDRLHAEYGIRTDDEQER